MADIYRKYSVRRHRKAVHRIWQECGWIGKEKNETDALDQFIKASHGWVFEMGGSAEALSLSTDGLFLHTATELSLAAITAVTTSRVGRNLGAASGTLSRLLAEQAEAGKDLSGLGIFEQGFYDRLGYGNGTYEHWVRFDPAWLEDLGKPRVPVRLGADDWKEIHASRMARRKLHGATDLIPPEITKSEMEWSKNIFGLGYRDGGELTHFFVAHADELEEGPYRVDCMVYRTVEQFRELLGLIRGFGDQIRYCRVREPRDIQLQSLLRKPFQLYTVTANSRNPSRANAVAYWQLRMLNVERCIAAVVAAEQVEFNLTLEDPIEDILPQETSWKGCGGDYTVRFGPVSEAVSGHTGGLPHLRATVNDFTRFWMGSASADVLAGLGSFEGPGELLDRLDRSVRIPSPAPDWDY